MKTSVLVVDDESMQRQSLAMRLERKGFQVASAASGREALTMLEMRKVEFALIDLRMPEMDGIELLRRIHARWPEITVIVMTAFSDVSTAIRAIKAGAFHYLEKPIKDDELLDAIANATPERRQDPFHGVSGESAAMKGAISQARNAATHIRPVLITGEIGTGKEALAGAIHAGSSRAKHPFVPIRCSVGGEELDAEIFGRSATAPGRIIEANGGTILFDRVEKLHPRAQERLMRFLQDGEIAREGEIRPVRADVRVISSTSTDLSGAVASGFRDDLSLLLSQTRIDLPPLRERPADIPGLARALAEKYSHKGSPRIRIDREATAALQAQAWPGNIVELEGLIEHAVSLAGPEGITMEVLRKTGVDELASSSDNHGLHPLKEELEHEEEKLIESSLARNNHNLRLVAIDLGISRTSLWRKMKRFRLEER